MIVGVTNSGSVTMIVEPERERSDDVLAVIVAAAVRETAESDTSVSGISGVTVRVSKATMDVEAAGLSS